MITYKFRLYPTEEQEGKLSFVLERCRWLYNRLLEEVNRARGEGRKLKPKDTQALIVLLKEERPELKSVNSKVLQMVNHRVWSNIRALHELKKKGRKVGKLRYKKYGKFKSFILNQSGFKIIQTGNRLDRLYISKVGEVPIRIHRSIERNIKQVIIKRYGSGEWYALVCVEEVETPKKEVESAIGIDVGIKSFLTDSEGREVENPRFYERALERLRVEHRKLSRKKKSSKNWLKQLRRLCKVYEKIERKRDDFLHKLSRFYVDNYDLIAVEDLGIENMKRNHNLSSEISDASWGKFLHYLSYKAASAGKAFVKVSPRGTSEGLSWDDPLRDYISARRILKRGLEKLGLGRPSEPVERELLLHVTASSVLVGQVSSMKQEPPFAGCPFSEGRRSRSGKWSGACARTMKRA
ncbi:MAG: Transposase [Candidatus Alkanophagales archaeon MCA70_species_2]|nr:Transposase [Candidatus Alkanophaga liquidiphilum]